MKKLSHDHAGPALNTLSSPTTAPAKTDAREKEPATSAATAHRLLTKTTARAPSTVVITTIPRTATNVGFMTGKVAHKEARLPIATLPLRFIIRTVR